MTEIIIGVTIGVIGLLLCGSFPLFMRSSRYCHRCAKELEGTPELVDQDGNCWHFDCWSRTANRTAAPAVSESKLPRCVCGWAGDEVHVCIDGSPTCPKCGDLIR